MTRLDCRLHIAHGASPIHFFMVLVTVLDNCKSGLGLQRQPERFLQDLPPYEVVHPTRVSVTGHFLSNFLSHRARRIQRRHVSGESMDQERVFYQLWHAGHSLHFNLTLNPHLLAPGFLTERRYGGLKGGKIRPPGFARCHFLGEVWDGSAVKGNAAISTCDGLTGLFKLSNEEFFIQPLEKPHDEPSALQAHAIFKRHASIPSSWSPLLKPISGKQAVNGSCGVKNSHHSLEAIERKREYWEQRQDRKKRRIHRRSISKEKWVETLVVADPKMVEYHGSKGVESYILAVMNIVAGLFQDPSIGNAINIVVVRLILLEQDEVDLKITHHADNSLSSFCKWQKRLNMKGDDHPLHHDVAVLLTRKDICASINMPCETLGLSHVVGMCQSHRSCSISEDTGLPLAFTVAHELGHNFGIQHDGNGNDCEPIGKKPFIMSPQLLYGTLLPKWSRCSRQYITRFLERLCRSTDLTCANADRDYQSRYIYTEYFLVVATVSELQASGIHLVARRLDSIVASGLDCWGKKVPGAIVTPVRLGSRKDSSVAGVGVLMMPQRRIPFPKACCFLGFCTARPINAGCSMDLDPCYAMTWILSQGSPTLEGYCPACFPVLPGATHLIQIIRIVQMLLQSWLMNRSSKSGMLQLGEPDSRQDSSPPGLEMETPGLSAVQEAVQTRVTKAILNVCNTLWCTVGATCHSKLDGAVDGTTCGQDKWCFSGQCIAAGHYPDSVNGAWGTWSEWSACSRSCGAGIESAQRDCDDPVGRDRGKKKKPAPSVTNCDWAYVTAKMSEEKKCENLPSQVVTFLSWMSLGRIAQLSVDVAVSKNPRNRGKYCLGERQRYRICNTTPCPNNVPTFRDIQCSHFNSALYKGKFYKWVSVISRVSPCELHCRPLYEHFSEKMLDAVTDGTPCFEGNKSRDMCINGICKDVGCDYVIGSNAVEDRCGVCLGNGSTCATVRKTFEESEGLGYVDIGLIPEGSWDIRIEEMAEAGNFLALRGDGPNKYYLNGGWTIQWNGEYKAAGAVFTYERTGHRENLTSPGPTMEPLWIQLLFQETNPGVRYEYTISQNISEDNNGSASVFFWKCGSWTECSATCGAGVQRQIFHCVERTNGIVDESLCDPFTRPDDNQTTCNKEPCPAIWWVGEWQKCSASCGSSGVAKRTVMCIQAISVDDQKALPPSQCESTPKPASVLSCNTDTPCPSDWTTGSWSKCSLTCGRGVRGRNVTCSRNTGVDCDLQKKPLSLSTCSIQDCPQVVDNFGDIDWSGSGWTSEEVLNEINLIPAAKLPPKYSSTKVQSKKSDPNDVNNIFEDFHYHNKIEGEDNTPKVDDFYYDYNFINFHEDLSDENAGIDSGNSQEQDFLHEEEPTGSVRTTTLSLKSAEPENITKDTLENIGNPGKGEPSGNFDDYLAADYLLPVPTTRSSPEHSSQKNGYDELLWNENNNASSPLNDTTGEPTKSKNVGQDTDEAENNHNFTGEENHTGEYTPSHAGSKPGIQAEERHTVTLTEKSREEDGLKLHQTSTMSQFATPKTLRSSGTVGASELYLTPSTNESTAFSPDYHVDNLHPTHLTTESVAIKDNSDRGVSTTSLPPSESSTLLLTPDLVMSGNRSDPDDTILSAGTQLQPPTNREGYSQPPPDRFQPATTEQSLTKASTEWTAADSSYTSSFPFDDHDYDQILIPPIIRSDIASDPDSSYNPPLLNTASTEAITTQKSKTSISPRQHSFLWPPPQTISEQTPAATQVAAFWVSGNWSSCSTSCGLGAIWRTLTCSTGSETDCDPGERPTPAQRCYLRPCSMWKVGEWTKCSRNCGGGIKSREVQCFDMRDQRPLRPFHCRAMSSRPQSQMTCNLQPCLDWYTSSWGQCSEVCGGGGQQRLVTCPEEDLCDTGLKPNNIQPCNTQPCVQWLIGSWGQCSASCGSGVQRRLIKCVNTKSETEQEVVPSQCDHEVQPRSTQKCHLDECHKDPPGEVCLSDRLTSRFCQTLQWLGRCQLPNVRAQCCKTCKRQPGRTSSISHH